MLSPPRLPALVTSFHATARSSRSCAATGVVRSVGQGILHADPCTLCMHGYRPPIWWPKCGLMSEAEEVETVHTLSNDLNVLALRRNVDIGLSSSNRIAGTNNQLNKVSRGNFEKITLMLYGFPVSRKHCTVFSGYI